MFLNIFFKTSTKDKSKDLFFFLYFYNILLQLQYKLIYNKIIFRFFILCRGSVSIGHTIPSHNHSINFIKFFTKYSLAASSCLIGA